MPIQTIPYTGMGQGFPGAYARNAECMIMSRQVVPADTLPVYFGDAVVLRTDIATNAGGAYSSVPAAVAAAHPPVMGGPGVNYTFAGVAIKEVKTNLGYPTSQSFGGYAQGTWADVLERGSVMVQCNNGTPAVHGVVYLRTVLNGAVPAGVVGGFEAVADGVNSIIITNAEWTTGIKDGNNIAEMTLRVRNVA